MYRRVEIASEEGPTAPPDLYMMARPEGPWHRPNKESMKHGTTLSGITNTVELYIYIYIGRFVVDREFVDIAQATTKIKKQNTARDGPASRYA